MKTAERSNCTHDPAIRVEVGAFRKHYIVCAKCGILLWFVPIEDFGINTDDWSAPPYPRENHEHDC